MESSTNGVQLHRSMQHGEQRAAAQDKEAAAGSIMGLLLCEHHTPLCHLVQIILFMCVQDCKKLLEEKFKTGKNRCVCLH